MFGHVIGFLLRFLITSLFLSINLSIQSDSLVKIDPTNANTNFENAQV